MQGDAANCGLMFPTPFFVVILHVFMIIIFRTALKSIIAHEYRDAEGLLLDASAWKLSKLLFGADQPLALGPGIAARGIDVRRGSSRRGGCWWGTGAGTIHRSGQIAGSLLHTCFSRYHVTLRAVTARFALFYVRGSSCGRRVCRVVLLAAWMCLQSTGRNILLVDGVPGG